MGTTRSWQPPLWTTWGQLLLAVVLAPAAALTDGPGRLLVVPVALALLASGLRDLVLRPVLTADGQGITVVDGAHRRTAPWSQVQRVRTVRDRRSPALELDLGDAVVVLGRVRLGADPDDVRAALLELRV